MDRHNTWLSGGTGRLVALVLGLLLLALAGCDAGSHLSADVISIPTPTVAPKAYRGTIVCAGSAVLAPLVQRAATQFKDLSADAFVLVITSTSKLGLSTLQDDGADIALSDVSADDLLAADAATLHEYLLGAVPYAIIANPQVGVSNLSRAQLQRIYTQQVHNWHELGGADLPITPLQASKGSGIRYLFIKVLMADQRGDADPDVLGDSSTNIVNDVANKPGALGYVPIGMVTDRVRMLNIDGVAPGVSSVAEGRYPFWSYARMYTKYPAGGLTQVFIDYLRSAPIQDKVVTTAGFVPLSRMKDRRQP